MSDIWYFDECPACKAEITDEMGMPELSGYEGDVARCSKCKAKFLIITILKKLNEKKK